MSAFWSHAKATSAQKTIKNRPVHIFGQRNWDLKLLGIFSACSLIKSMAQMTCERPRQTVGVGQNCSCVETPRLFETGMDGVPVFGWVLEQGRLVSVRVIAGRSVLCFERPVHSFQQSKLIISSCSPSMERSLEGHLICLIYREVYCLKRCMHVCVWGRKGRVALWPI